MVELMKPSRARQQPESFRRRGGDCDQSGALVLALERKRSFKAAWKIGGK